MTVTLGNLLGEVENLGYNSGLDIKYSVIYDFVENIKAIIINLVGVQEGHIGDEEFELPTSIEVNNNTLLSISNEIDATMAEDNLFANFEALVGDDYADYFETITEIYDENGINGLRNHITEISNSLPTDTPLYRLSQLILKGMDLQESMIIVLSEKGIDINKSPLVSYPEEVDIYIKSIRDYIAGLIKIGDNYIIPHTSSLIN